MAFVTTLILFTTGVPHPLTETLIAAGFHVLEALAISEVFAFVEEHPRAQVIVGTDIGPERTKLIQQHYPPVHLKGNTDLQDMLWDMEVLLPKAANSHSGAASNSICESGSMKRR
jgi:hypothetical protein